MRLGQLARRLALRPTEIVDYLAKQSITIDPGNNTRIEDDHLALVLQKFAPEGLAEIAEQPQVEEEKVVDMPQTISADIAHVIIEVPIAEPEKDAQPEKIELIKAPKVELSGLKVLGKIELPETKKKEIPASDESSVDGNAEPRREQRRPSRQQTGVRKDRTNHPQRPAKNPIAIQREQEAREAEQKRQEDLVREKEKRTLHYMKKMTVAQPVKAIKIQEEKVTPQKQIIKKQEEPTSVWGKFKRWLTS